MQVASLSSEGRSRSIDAVRRRKVRFLVVLYLVLIGGLPAATALAPVLVASSPASRLAMAALAPASFCVAYPLVCGILSRLTRRGLVAGRFPRDLGHGVYGPRRLHALCWTALYYATPVYHAVLALPWLKAATFRLFGYRGSLDFTVYPDTWIRDLPLLDLGEGAYVANRATLGTNVCLREGAIVVQPVRIGRRSLVGHLSAIAPGVTVGDDVEIHACTAIGAGVRIGDRTRVGARCTFESGVAIGPDCRIESCVRIGKRARIGAGIRLRFGSLVPSGASIVTQSDADRLAAPAPGWETRVTDGNAAPARRYLQSPAATKAAQ